VPIKYHELVSRKWEKNMKKKKKKRGSNSATILVIIFRHLSIS